MRAEKMRSVKWKLGVALLVAMAVPAAAWASGQLVQGSVTFGSAFQETVNGIVQYQIPLSVSSGTSYSNGTGVGQVDTVYAKQLNLLTSTPQTIDLTSLTDPAGNAINFARVREFIVQNTATTANYDVKVSQAASTGWPILPLAAANFYCRQGASIKISDPNSTARAMATSSGRAGSVTFDPGARAITINVLIVGGSAL